MLCQKLLKWSTRLRCWVEARQCCTVCNKTWISSRCRFLLCSKYGQLFSMTTTYLDRNWQRWTCVASVKRDQATFCYIHATTAFCATSAQTGQPNAQHVACSLCKDRRYLFAFLRNCKLGLQPITSNSCLIANWWFILGTPLLVCTSILMKHLLVYSAFTNVFECTIMRQDRLMFYK